jgi:C4-type Zn-finger protein
MPYIKKERYEKLLEIEKRYEQNSAYLRERFRIKSKCDSCGYQSMDIYPKDERPCPHWDCNGSMKEML